MSVNTIDRFRLVGDNLNHLMDRPNFKAWATPLDVFGFPLPGASKVIFKLRGWRRVGAAWAALVHGSVNEEAVDASVFFMRASDVAETAEFEALPSKRSDAASPVPKGCTALLFFRPKPGALERLRASAE